MLTGRGAQEVLGILRGTSNTLPATLPPKVKQVLQRATDEKPEKRHASVTGLVNAFKLKLAPAPIQIPPPTITNATGGSNLNSTPTKGPTGSQGSSPNLLNQSPPKKPSPLVAILPKNIVAAVAKMVLPGLVAGVLLLLAGVLVWSLPATHSKPLGGLTDLSGYCQFLRYAHEEQEGTADRYCFSSITILGLPLTKQPTW